MIPTQPCELCATPELTVVATTDRHGQPLETVLCPRCGLVRQSELPSLEALEAFYRESYRREYHGEERPSPKRVVRAWRRGQALFKRLQPFVPEDGKVFEVGAGLGLNLKAFQLAGFSTDGIEPNETFGTFSRETLHTTVRPGHLETVDPDPTHDLVILTHVIEHLRSPRAGLEAIGERLLAPSGAIYVECPNLAAPFAKPSKLFHRAHLFNFTPETLAGVAAQAGFGVAQSFASERDPTIAVLLRRDPSPPVIDPATADRVRRALRTGWLRYHLNPAYLSLRVTKLKEKARESRETQAAYAAILEACRP